MIFYICFNLKQTQMNLHEYQGKELLSKFGVNIQRGIVIENLSEVEEAGKKIAEM